MKRSKIRKKNVIHWVKAVRKIFSIAHETSCRQSHATNGKRRLKQLRAFDPPSPAPKPSVFPCGEETVEGLTSRTSSSPRSELVAVGRLHLAMLQHHRLLIHSFILPNVRSIYFNNSSRKSRTGKNVKHQTIIGGEYFYFQILRIVMLGHD